MNETFRHKKGPTDVLSFPSSVAPASLPAFFPSDKQNAVPNRGHVGAQDSCAPGPPDRSVSSSRRIARKKMRAPVTAASGEGTASAVPNPAMQRGALAPEAHHLGDIAISPATARRNAKKFGRTLPDELQILILHGVLHLLGYDHETDKGQMTRVENRLRRKLGLQ
jgi:rRNA maturation RNase YbeY